MPMKLLRVVSAIGKSRINVQHLLALLWYRGIGLEILFVPQDFDTCQFLPWLCHNSCESEFHQLKWDVVWKSMDNFLAVGPPPPFLLLFSSVEVEILSAISKGSLFPKEYKQHFKAEKTVLFFLSLSTKTSTKHSKMVNLSILESWEFQMGA